MSNSSYCQKINHLETHLSCKMLLDEGAKDDGIYKIVSVRSSGVKSNKILGGS